MATESAHEQLQSKAALEERLRRAAFRLEMAAVERAWAIHTAKAEGLSVREIAAVVGLGPTRVHQILTNNQGFPIEAAANALRGAGWPAPENSDVDPSVVADRIRDEAGLIGSCAEWLTQLPSPDVDVGDGLGPVVNLRPEDDWPDTHMVEVDRERIVRMLRRISADLDELAAARSLTDTAIEAMENGEMERLRRRYAEPDIPKPSGPMGRNKARRAWDQHDKAMRRAGLQPPVNPYRHHHTPPDPDRSQI